MLFFKFHHYPIVHMVDDTPTKDRASRQEAGPWLGLESYSEADAAKFFGRESELAELTRRVDQRTLTVLFSQSGLGKTSLLRAGLFPALRRKGFLPLYIRLDHTEGAARLQNQVWRILDDELGLRGRYADGERDEKTTLWEWFHDVEEGLLSPSLRGVTPVLVFDQFEEIFTLGATRHSDLDAEDHFLRSCAWLAENQVPEPLEARFEEDPEEVSRFEFATAAYRVLIALREDYLSQLDRARNLMPSLMQNRMPLNRLTGRQALAPVVKPAQDLVDEEIAERIVRFVGGEDDLPLEAIEVEPSLLSLVLSELNRKRIDTGLPVITAELLGGSREEILDNYYEDCFADLDLEARHFVEDRLLTDSGYRNCDALENAQKIVGADAISKLVNSRLLHIDQRGRTKRVELTHDVLTKVVARSRDRRRERERREKAEEEKRLAEEQARAMRSQQARQRMIALVMTGLFVISAIMAWIAVRKGKSATAAQAEAEMARELSTDFVKSLAGDDMVFTFKKMGQLAKLDDFYEVALKDLLSRPESDGRDELEVVLRQERGGILIKSNDPDAAISQFNHARQLISGKVGENWDLLGLRNLRGLGRANQEKNELKTAKVTFEEAIGEADKLHDSTDETSKTGFAERACDEVADTYFDYAWLLLEKEGNDRAGEAREFLEKSLHIRDHQCKKGQEKHGQRASTLRLIGKATSRSGKEKIDQAVDHYREAISEFEPTDLSRQGDCQDAIMEMATILLNNGKPDQAIKELTAAREKFDNELNRYPNKDDALRVGPLRQLAVTKQWLGESYSQKGEAARAGKLYEECQEDFVEAYQLDQRNVDLRQSQLNARKDYTAYLRKKGRVEEARIFAEKTVEERNALHEAVPRDATVLYDLAMDHDGLAFIYLDLDMEEKSLAAYEEGMKIRREFIREVEEARGLAPAVWKLDLSRSYNYMGNADLRKADYQGAYDWYKKAKDVRQELFDAAPEDILWQARLAFCHDRLGMVSHEAAESGKYNETWATLENALQSHENALRLRELVLRRDENEPSAIVACTASLMKIGRVYFDQNKPEEAKTRFEESQNLREKLWKADPSNQRYATAMADTLFWLAAVAQGEGQIDYQKKAGVFLDKVEKPEHELQVSIDKARSVISGEKDGK